MAEPSTMAAKPELMPTKTAWTDVVAAKRAIRNEHIERHRSTFANSPLAAKILDIADIDSLIQLLEGGEASAEDVVKAYIAK
jgi:hypothetical protein